MLQRNSNSRKKLRREVTPSERILWRALRTNKLEGFHFRRQQVIAGFIADFYCASAHLAIEIDGGAHLTKKDDDHERDQALLGLGIRTLRFSNDSVDRNLAAVLRSIFEEVKQRSDQT